MNVPTTPTSTDRLEEVRKLNVEIAGLQSAKDIADQAFNTARTAADEARQRANALNAHITALEGSMSEISAEMREFIATCRNILQTVVMTMEVASMQAKTISQKVNQLIEETVGLEKTKRDLTDTIARENELISQQRADLDIYHRRIVIAATEYLPGQKITI